MACSGPGFMYLVLFIYLLFSFPYLIDFFLLHLFFFSWRITYVLGTILGTKDTAVKKAVMVLLSRDFLPGVVVPAQL